jgi:hypothetical protein
MSDQNTTSSSEGTEGNAGEELLDAFLAAEEQGVADSKGFERPTQNANGEGDTPDDEANATEDVQTEAEAEAAPEGDEEAEVEATEPDGDYVEHEGKKIAVSELMDAYKFKQSTFGQLDQIRNEVVTRTQQQMAGQAQELKQRTEALDSAFEYLEALYPTFQRPPASMLVAGSPDYDPDTYHYLTRQIDEIEARKAEAKSQVEKAREQRKQEASKQAEQAIAQSAQILARVVPGWSDPKAMIAGIGQLQDALKAHYHFDDAVLNTVTDPRFYLVALDAAKYRALQAKGAPKPKEGAKAAPRLVRSTAKPSAAAPAQRQRAKAMEALRKTGKTTNLEAIWGDHI